MVSPSLLKTIISHTVARSTPGMLIPDSSEAAASTSSGGGGAASRSVRPRRPERRFLGIKNNFKKMQR